MKFKVLCNLVMMILPGSIMANAQGAPSPAQKPATFEELAALRREAEQNSPMKRMLKAATPEEPSKAKPPRDLISRSDLIFYRGMATLVPKRAIIHMPEKLKDRLVAQPDARLHGWAEFYAANRSWITTVEVSRAQAEGKTPLTEETVKQMGTSSNMMVATFMGGPISVLPLKAPEETNPPAPAK